MVCARRNSVYAFFIGFFICTQGVAPVVCAKGDKDEKLVTSHSTSKINAAPATEFQWMEHKKLSWDDFRGPVMATNDESAAATHCGIGFIINGILPSGKPDVVVYNTFYMNKSWVRSDAKISTILAHEQGHFDLCELYTRRLSMRISSAAVDETNFKQTFLNIFNEVNNEYELCQQAYEDETIHGTNIPVQMKWQDKISRELN